MIKHKDFKWRWGRILFVFICGLSIFLCALFPYELNNGFGFDLRTIPLLLGTLYTGAAAGILLALFLFLIQSLVDIDALWLMLLVYLPVLTITLLQRVYFLKSGRFRKALLTFGLCMVPIVILYLIGFYLKAQETLFSPEFTIFVAFYTGVNAVAVWVVIYTLEQFMDHLEMRDKLRTSEKNSLVSELAASFAHEIRNPLTVVQGFAQLLKTKEFDEDKRQNYLQLMDEELKRAQTILNEYLSFSKPIGQNTERIQVHTQLAKVAEIMTPYAQMNEVELEYVPPAHPSLFIQANPIEVNQVLINMIKNAVEASQTRGRVTLSVRPPDSRYVEISVKDNGKGMDAKTRASLFRAYASAKKDGTGLGLAVCARIVDSMRGKIECDSEPGQGTEFRIRIPQA